MIFNVGIIMKLSQCIRPNELAKAPCMSERRILKHTIRTPTFRKILRGNTEALLRSQRSVYYVRNDGVHTSRTMRRTPDHREAIESGSM
jgi:hypothetical protein